jgi:hypothetical protein
LLAGFGSAFPFAVQVICAVNDLISKDYSDLAEVQAKFYDTWQTKTQEGDPDAMERIQKAGGPGMFVRLDGIKDVLTTHSKMVRDIYKNPDIPGDQKRQLIDGLYFNMIEVAKVGKENGESCGVDTDEGAERRRIPDFSRNLSDERRTMDGCWPQGRQNRYAAGLLSIRGRCQAG